MAHSVSQDEMQTLSTALARFFSNEPWHSEGRTVFEGWDVEVKGHSIILRSLDHTFAVFLDVLPNVVSLRAAELAQTYLAESPPQATSDLLPAAEKAAWEEIGADFTDDGVVQVVHAASAAAYEELLGRCIIGDADVARLLDVDRSRVSQRATFERSLYGFIDTNEQRCYPTWQFVDGKTLPGLKTVLAALDPELHPLTVDRWFTRPDVDLVADDIELTPVEWLRSGGSPKRVADHARFL